MTDQPTTPDQPAAPADQTGQAAPATAQPMPPAPAIDAQPQPNKGVSLLKRFAVPLLIGLAFVGFRVYNSQTAADKVDVGQCVSRQDDDSIKTVDCTSAEADFKVLKIEQDSSESAAETVCGPVSGFTTTYFEGKEDGSKGDLICLGDPK